VPDRGVRCRHGKVLGSIGDSRTKLDYVTFLQGVFATDRSTATWHVMSDNLNISPKAWSA
jgi:hypothetical protein